MTMRRREVFALAGYLSAGVFVACKDGDSSGVGKDGPTGGGSGSEEIVIGHYASMTGKEAHFGQDTDKAIRMAAEELNAKGGVLKKEVKIVTVDTRGDSAEAANAVTRLIDVDKAVALLGEVASSLSLAGGRVAQRRKIPMISPSSTNPAVTEVGDYIFRVCFIDPFQGNVMAKFARDNLKLERVAIIKDVKNDYSIGLSDAFKKAYEGLGGKITIEQSYSAGDTDFSAQITAIKGGDAQAIYVPGYYSEVGAIARTAKRLGVDLPLLGGDGWDAPDLVKIGGDDINGCYFSNHFAPDVATENAKKFIADFEKQHKSKPTGLAALGYDAANVLFKAIEKAGKLDSTAIRDEIAKTKDYEGVTGTITLNDKRDADKSAVVIKIDGGQFKYEATVKP
jgi:branched-chain amino acid transport system substrate-binding protein